MNLLFKFKTATLALCLLATQLAIGNNSFFEIQKINGSDANNFSEFGYASDIDGDWAVIGAPQNGNGAVHVFKRQGDIWIESQKLTSSDPGTADFFGAAVDIDGNRMLIGAPNDDNVRGIDAGAFYYFEYDGSTWIEVQKIYTSVSNSGSEFGLSLSLSGNRAVVGVDTKNTFSGSMVVYQFNGENWAYQTQIFSPNTQTDSRRFARILKVKGDLIAVSDFQDDDQGALYVYEFDAGNWSLVQRLTASDGSLDQNFGTSIDLQENTVAIGASGDTANAGAVYIFSNASSLLWTEQIKLSASDSIANGFFGGTGMVLKDNLLLVGASQNLLTGTGSTPTGAAYLFQNQTTGWQEIQKITPSDGAFDDQFGFSLAMDSDHILVGARYEDDNGMNSGSAYLYLSDLIFNDSFE